MGTHYRQGWPLPLMADKRKSSALDRPLQQAPPPDSLPYENHSGLTAWEWAVKEVDVDGNMLSETVLSIVTNALVLALYCPKSMGEMCREK